MESETVGKAPQAEKSAPASRQPMRETSPERSLRFLHRSMGNRALGLLLQTKLKVGPAGDQYEQEADRVAEQVVSAQQAPILQRKCSCSGGASCSKCAADQEEELIQRSIAAPALRSSALSLQRAPADPTATPAGAAPATTAAAPSPSPDVHRPQLIVEDDASVAPGQMKKSAFFDLLEADICATADAELAAVGRSTKSCPYIEKWLAFYRGQDSGHIEQALLKYAPDAAGATSAQDYIQPVRQRVRQAVATWAKTGQMTGVPPGVGLMPSTAGPAEAAKSEVPGTGAPQTNSGGGEVQRKERAGTTARTTDAATVRSQLGHGRALDSSVRERMGSAFGHDFSSVRVHDDASAFSLSAQLNARAFTVGNDVAFGAGEYKPGTLVGDALIAHELAHVVQQGAASQSSVPMMKGDADYSALEQDADVSAVGAVASLWVGAKGKLADVGRNATPRLRSGLRLQRCQEVKKLCPKGYSWRVQNTTGIGSLGCLCHWKCMPGEDPRVANTAPTQEYRCPPEIDCSTGVRYEELDSSYTKTGYGAAMTPLGEQAYCGCFPLDKEGKKVSDAPLKPTDFEMTDVLGPLADVAAAAKAKAKPRLDPTTGMPLPGKSAPATEHDVRPKVTVVGDLGVDVAVGNARAAEYRDKFNAGKRRNVAFADYDVAGKKGTFVGISGEAEREGTVPVPPSPELPTLVAGHTREFDSEKKILEKLISIIGDNPDATGTVSLFSEKDVCVGCDLAMAAFRAKYPKIDLRVVSGKK